MKVATCFQHVLFEGPGVFRQALEAQGYVVKTILVPSQGLPSDPGDFLLIMGGPMSVNDADSWIAEELHVVKAAMEQRHSSPWNMFWIAIVGQGFGWIRGSPDQVLKLE